MVYCTKGPHALVGGTVHSRVISPLALLFITHCKVGGTIDWLKPVAKKPRIRNDMKSSFLLTGFLSGCKVKDLPRSVLVAQRNNITSYLYNKKYP